ncbi:MAG: hypothetical protein AAB834_07155 [Patescibacteria group bacterium]
MHIPKKYLHDKFVLLLVSINAFLAFLCIVLILLRAGIGQGVDGYIVEYRANLGLSAFQKGSIISIFSFVFFVLVTTAMNVVLSIRTYQLRRTLSLTLLGLGVLILLLSIIVSNALLALY